MRPYLLSCVLFAAACGPDVSSSPDGPGADAAGNPDANGTGTDGNVADFSKVYVNSPDSLYRLDTTTLMPVLIGPFANLGTQSMTDIAVDKGDQMVGITLNKIYTVDVTTGEATLIANVEAGTPNFTSLSFVPVDLSEPDGDEILVAAADDGTVYEIDRTSGVTTPLGAYGTVTEGVVRSSGDIVAVRGAGIFATVTIGDADGEPDHLAQIDPVTWAATPLATQTNYDKIFGIGYWRGHIYGLVDLGSVAGGAIVELDPVTGASTLVDQGDIRWYGAGVTTNAPIVD